MKIFEIIIIITFVLWVAIPLIQICWGSKKLGGMTDYGN